MTTQLRQAAACLAVLAALAGGCAKEADDGSVSADASTTEGDAAQPADKGKGGGERSAADLKADEAAAKRMLLTTSDMPPGFKPTAGSGESDAGGGSGNASDDEADAAFAKCIGEDSAVTADTDNPSASSPDFANDDASKEISSEVEFTASADEARKDFAVLTRATTSACIQRAIKDVLTKQAASDPSAPADLKIGEPAVEPLPSNGLGDESGGFRLSVPISTQGVSVTVYFDLVATRVGRIEITTTFLSTGEPPVAADEQRLTEVVVDRAPAAEAA